MLVCRNGFIGQSQAIPPRPRERGGVVHLSPITAPHTNTNEPRDVPRWGGSELTTEVAHYKGDAAEIAAGLKQIFLDLTDSVVVVRAALLSVTAEPIRKSHRPASNFGRKHEENTNRGKNIAAAAPRSLREATATRLLRWHTR